MPGQRIPNSRQARPRTGALRPREAARCRGRRAPSPHGLQDAQSGWQGGAGSKDALL
eukprot:CAMPEP_0175286818 /NCGR_PEP_ID=MMETSP0093-20121207/53959_1 /TAXON_ID=311494 /ORGANISM="Alexandrium monilatum, Strain CCMP3105" /LENGTH=56 /DNA_ID=CAMNT_0016582295 /DNA_START=62 /DNA_END=229 /DNA_ORIENTATION=-